MYYTMKCIIPMCSQSLLYDFKHSHGFIERLFLCQVPFIFFGYWRPTFNEHRVLGNHLVLIVIYFFTNALYIGLTSGICYIKDSIRAFHFFPLLNRKGYHCL